MEPRYEELFSLIHAELKRSGYLELMAAGVVLTGGSAKMTGVIDLAEEVFHTQVRLGIPQYVRGLADVVQNPVYATGVGLLLFGSKNDQGGTRVARAESGLAGMWERMKNWFHGNF